MTPLLTPLLTTPFKIIVTMGMLLTLSFGAVASNTSTSIPHKWKLDTPKTDVGFEVKYLFNSKIKGKFNKVNGSISYDMDRPSDTVIRFTVNTNSVDTKIKARDRLLRRESLLNSANYPTMTFVSKKVNLINPRLAKVTGDFTVLGQTKPLTIKVVLSKASINPVSHKPVLKFSATALINRKTYGVTALPGLIGELIPIKISGELIAAN